MRKIIVIVLLLGWGMTVFAQQGQIAVQYQTMKFNHLLGLIDAFYVDTVNLEKLTESAIVKVLEELDPHSVYISKEELEEMNEPLEGEFSGIGIQFTLLRDTLMVVAVVPGGPSEKVGLRAGDRIVDVDGENIAGVGLTNKGVRSRLKGPKGSLVAVKVCRKEEVLDFSIKRDKIPIHSVDAKYMLDKTTAYIRISRFGATTTEEFERALTELKAQGMKDLILDLQGNGGGFMEAATDISDHFLPAKNMIVYTEGRAFDREERYATAKGLFEKGRLMVLIDEYSASASEIVSGAVQDWDRGVIVGRRSFGKGLVQRQIPIERNGAMIRLTVSHYYTPSGRDIQKPYKDGDYGKDLYDRYEHGELFSADSIVINDTVKYYTQTKRRVVYGGGGIIPDLFVPVDTSINYTYMNRLIAKNVINEYVVNYIDRNREQLNKRYPDFRKFEKEFEVTDAMIADVVAEGEKAGVVKDEKLLNPVLPAMKRQIKALVARDIWDMNEMFMILNQRDEVLKAARKALKDGTYEKILK